ncbi:MAG TPA: branched-chain amino acid ABC transporter substrate-binding protein [Actinomycetota bacterium]|nr:branched-chain amino acid ABC transporter substrate-binding protein [Actinomycetota bacterium]
MSLLVLMMFVAAACGGGDGGGGGTTQASGDCDPSTLEPAQAPEGESPAGPGAAPTTASPAAASPGGSPTGASPAAASPGGSPTAAVMRLAQAKPTVTIGTFGDRTGDNANIILPSHDGMALAIKQANESGNLPVTLTFKALDNRNAGAETAPAIAQQFIGDPSVVAVLGGGFSGETAATGSLFSEAGLLFFTASATRPDLTESGFRTFFRGLANDNDQGSGIIQAFEHLGCERVAVVDDKSPYGQGLGNATRRAAEEANLEVVLSESIEPTTDYTALVDSVVAADPQALFYAGYAAQFQLVARQLREKGYEGIIASGDGSKEEEIGEKIGRAEAENVLLTCACPDINLSPEEDAQRFVDAFEAEYARRPGIYAAEGYDVANTTIEAIRECGENGGAGGVTRQCVVQNVRDSDYEGITKRMSFAENGQVEAGTVSLFVIRDGVVREVGPVDDL